MDYLYNLTPYAHQDTAMHRSMDAQYYALFMEMGTGKTKVIIDTAMHLYGRGLIDTVVVVAPNGVHQNWVLKELPEHMHEAVPWAAAYYAAQAKAQERKQWDRAQSAAGSLRWLCFNVESASNKKGQHELERAVKFSRCLFVIDESHTIKTPGVKRTRFLVTLSKHAEYRRILTGTPLSQSPLDFYSQLRFLDPEITGFKTFTAFRAHFAVLEKRKTNNNRRGWYEAIVEYRNIHELEDAVSKHSYRVRKKECLDLPDKVYETRYVPITPEQKRVYDQLVEDSVAVLTEEYALDIPPELRHASNEQLLMFFADKKISAKNAMTKLLRLQQVLCGYAPYDDGEEVEFLPSKRPDILMDITEEMQGKALIFARFRHDLATIANMLRERYGQNSVREYHGGVPKSDRPGNVKAFQEDDEVRFFVAQQHSGGVGLTLTAATTVIYYSNDYSLIARQQSEDRAHRIGQKNNVTYIDLVCKGSVDEKILEALQEKQRMAEDFNYEGNA